MIFSTCSSTYKQKERDLKFCECINKADPGLIPGPACLF